MWNADAFAGQPNSSWRMAQDSAGSLFMRQWTSGSRLGSDPELPLLS